MHHKLHNMRCESLKMVEEIWCCLLQTARTIEVTNNKDLLKASVSLVPWNSVEKWIELVREHYFSFDLSRALFPILRLFGFTGDKLTEYNNFPFQEDNINNWFVQEVTGPGQNETHRVNIMNVNASGRRRKCFVNQNNIRNFPSDLSSGNFEVFFHGTNHVGAKNIIEKGILKTKGCSKRDFSSGDGFYLDTDFDHALEWASINSSRPAVLIWRVENNEFRERYKGLDFRIERSEEPSFQKVVSNFRSGKPDPSFRKQLDRMYDYIEGPWSAGPWPDDGRVLRGRATALDETNQLCLRNDACFEFFNSCKLHSAVFFKD